MKLIDLIIRLFKWLFNPTYYETGSVLVSSLDSGKEIFISTSREVEKVWFNVIPICDYPVPNVGCCLVSEATPVGGGFVFVCQTENECNVNWLAVENA